MNMFKPTSAKTPEEYIELVAEPRKTEIKRLYEFIKKVVPELKPLIIAGMIGFGTYHYKYASGREGDWTVIGLASQKNYISLYICLPDADGYVPEKYKSKLPNASIGKSCIRFKKIEDIDMKVLEEIIKKGALLAKNTQSS